VMSVPIDLLRKVPQVIGVVSGSDRSAAILAAIRGNIIKALVIDEVGASALLATPTPAPGSSKTKKTIK
jgi:deoxyribonucleoside regulator